jgi:O-antigen ligase
MNILRSRVSSVLGVFVFASVIVFPIARSVHYTSFFLTVGVASYILLISSIKEKFITESIVSAKWTYMFLVAPILSIPWSIMPTRSAFHAVLLIAFGLIFTISHTIFLKKRIVWFYNTIIYSTTIFSATFLTALLMFGSVRVSGGAGELLGALSNRIPAVVLPFVPYLYGMWKIGRKKVWVVITSVLVLFIVLTSESRAAYGITLSYLVLIPYFMSRQITRAIKHTLGLSLLGGIAVIGIYFLTGSQFLQPVLERFSESQLLQMEIGNIKESGGDFARAAMFLEGYNIVTNSPLIGIGYKTFKVHMEEFYPFGIISHNIIISVWGEMGIFGLVSFVGMVSTAFWHTNRGQAVAQNSGEEEKWLFLGASKIALTVLLIHAMVRPQLSNPTFWIVLAACMGVGKNNYKTTMR